MAVRVYNNVNYNYFLTSQFLLLLLFLSLSFPNGAYGHNIFNIRKLLSSSEHLSNKRSPLLVRGVKNLSTNTFQNIKPSEFNATLKLKIKPSNLSAQSLSTVFNITTFDTNYITNSTIKNGLSSCKSLTCFVNLLGELRQEKVTGRGSFYSNPNILIRSSVSIINKRRRIRSLSKTGKKKVLNILGLFELTQNNTRRESGESELAAAQLALDDINSNDSILPDYHIMMHTNDTQCDPGAGVDAFFHALYMRKDNKIISLLGTACSEVTERLAKVTTHQRIVQVSFGSTSPSLSDRIEFPLFYRTVAPVSSHAEAIIELIRHFNWDTVSFFTKNENRYTMPVNFLVKELEEKGNITCKATLTFSLFDFRDQLQDMKDLDARIIIANFGTDVAPLVFCEVFKMGMYGRDYSWILIGKPETLWWMDHSIFNVDLKSALHKPDCSLKQLSKAIENTLIFDRYNMLNGVSDFGLTTETFSKRLKGGFQSPFAPESYDAVWSVALGLNQLKYKYNYSLENFDYMDDRFSYALNEEIGRLNFTGISGPIRFLGSDRVGITSFMQIQGGSIVPVGLLHPDKLTNKLELSTCANCRPIRWHGNQIPIARREFRIKLIRVESSLYIIVASTALLGILMAATFLAFNLYYRKLKYIKLSSPRLNNMLIIGCIFAYIAVILLGSDFDPVAHSDGKGFAYICTIRAYLLSMGFSLAFGSMFAKTYRVHRIFTRSCIGVVKNKLLRDTQLMTLIMALILIDVIIVTSWAIFDPMKVTHLNLTLQIDASDRSVVYQPKIEVCRSQHGNVWLSVIYGYKRHVKIQALNDSKNIAYCVYIVVLTSILAVSLANLISERVTLSFVSVTSLILISTTVTLCLLFLPKIHTIITGGHKGDPVVESMGLKIEFNTRRLVVEDPAKELLFRAEVQNRVYKRQIEAIDLEIRRLENLLCSSNSSLSSLNKQNQEINTSPILKKNSSPRESSSDETSSEIYTVYLHGPRFIVPISVLSFQNPNALMNSSATNFLNNTLHPTSTLSPFAPPRSSWPNVRSLLAPSNGLIAKKYRFKSEPKLLIEVSNEIESNPRHSHQPTHPLLFTQGGISDESLILLSKSSKTAKSSRRKSSNTSGGGGTNSSSKRSSILSVLKTPFTYFTGVLRSTYSPTNTNNTNGSQLDLDRDLDNPSLSDLDQHYLSVPRDSIRHKYSSVPDLWAVRGSPVLQNNRKKNSILSDSVIDTSNLFYLSGSQSISNPVLKLTMTSDESPYL